MHSHLEAMHTLSHGSDLVVCFSKLSLCIYVLKKCDRGREMSMLSLWP